MAYFRACLSTVSWQSFCSYGVMKGSVPFLYCTITLGTPEDLAGWSPVIFSDKEIHWLHWSMNFLITIKINVVKWPSLTFIILKDSWLKDAHEMKISASLSFFSSVSDKVLFGISLNIKHSSLTVMFQSCKLYRCFLLVCFFLFNLSKLHRIMICDRKLYRNMKWTNYGNANWNLESREEFAVLYLLYTIPLE